MYYRDLTHAAPIVQREIDLAHTASTSDALTVYLMRYEHIRECTSRGTASDPDDAGSVSNIAASVTCSET